MKKAINGTTVTFTFDGDLPPVVFDATQASAEMRAYAEMHGWQARLGDNAALSRKQPDGTVITVTEAMRRQAVAELADHYTGNDSVPPATVWNMKAKTIENPSIRKLADMKFGGDYVAAQKDLADRAIADMQAIIDAEAAAKAE